MPRATFNFGATDPHTMEVDYRWWGREAYFLDGELIESKWSFSLAGLREFKIGNSKVRIEIAVGPKEYFTRVFVDDKLHVEELFPHVKAQVERWKKPPHSYLSPIFILSTCVLFALWLGGTWK